MKTVSFVLPILGAALISSAALAAGGPKQEQAKAPAAKQAVTATQSQQIQGRVEAKKATRSATAVPNTNAPAKTTVSAMKAPGETKSAPAAKRAHHRKMLPKKASGM